MSEQQQEEDGSSESMNKSTSANEPGVEAAADTSESNETSKQEQQASESNDKVEQEETPQDEEVPEDNCAQEDEPQEEEPEAEAKETEEDRKKSKKKKKKDKKKKEKKNKKSKTKSKKHKKKSKDPTRESKKKSKDTKKGKSKKSKSSKAKSKDKPTAKNKLNKSTDRKARKNKTTDNSDLSNSTKKKSADIKQRKNKKVDLSGAKIGFVGAGKMSEAIVRGLISVAKIAPKKIFVAGKSGKTLDIFESHGVTVSKRAYDIFGKFDCDIVFLCVHGYVIRACFKGGGTRPYAFTVNYIPNQKHPVYVLSLIGGVKLSDIRLTLLDPDDPDKYFISMNRLMLNIGVRYGLGLGGLDMELDSKECSPIVRELLSTIAPKIDFFPEQMMDAACAIGGNGLAFCYFFIANLADGGFKMGLNKVMATKLAAKALQSAAQCLLESNKHPSELQDSVTSQAGPAIYGIHVMEKADCASGFQEAIQASYRRLRELIDVEPITGQEAKPF